VLAGLVRLVAPVRRQVRITSPADWAIRRLAQDPQAPALGFDPLLYLDLERGEGGTAPPLRIGAYGYLDEHPLALRVWGAPADYLAARAEALWAQAPASMWYIRAALLARALDDGFDWIAWLRQRGASVTAWTFTPAHPHHIALAQQLVAAGAARLTTTDAPGLAAALGGQAVWGG
jgi:glycerophosphoryl diester phosphodiesterase